MTDKTPLQTIQDDAAAQLGVADPASREALDAFLVQAFDAGIAAVRAMDAELARTDAAEASRRKMARARLDDPNYRVRGTGRS